MHKKRKKFLKKKLQNICLKKPHKKIKNNKYNQTKVGM